MKRSRALVTVAVVVALTTACAADSTSGLPSPADSGTIDPALLAPLTALGPCRVEPPSPDPTAVEGLVLPPAAIVSRVREDGALTSVEGYIPRTPVEVRAFYQEHPTLEVVQIEDEVFESESLVSDGTNRLFVKAQAVCERGSVFVAFVAPEAGGAEVPAPAGSPPP